MNTSNFSSARLIAASLFLAAVVTVPAQSVVTEPVGFTTLTVAAKPGSGRGFTYLSVNMVRPTEFRSIVPVGGAATVTGQTVLTFPANSFTANQFFGTANAHFIELTNGTSAGVLADVVSNTTNTVTLAEDITSLIVGGSSTVRVRPHWTFGTLFGTANTAGFLAGTSGTADLVSILNPATGGFSNYYYSSANSRWQIGLSTIANDVVIRPDAGLLIERKLTSAFSFTVVGEVKLGTTEVVIVGGSAAGNYTLAPNPYPLPSVTLAASGLYTGNTATGVLKGTSGTADIVSIFNSGTGGFSNYYYSAANNRWQTGLSTVADTVVIPEGAAVLIFRRPGNGSFSWFVPQPAMNL